MAGGGGENEINLVPYMDIMLNLVMFMLVITVQDFQMAEILTPASRSSSQGAGASKPDDSEKPVPKPMMKVVVDVDKVTVFVKNPQEGVEALDLFYRTAPPAAADASAEVQAKRAAMWNDVGAYAADVVTKFGPKGVDANGQPEVMDVRLAVDPAVPYQEVVRGFDALRDACRDPSKRDPDPKKNEACGPVPITTVVLETKSKK